MSFESARCRRRIVAKQRRHARTGNQRDATVASLVSEEGAKGSPGAAKAAANASARLRPIERQVAPLRRLEAIHGQCHIEQKAPLRPSILGQGHKHLAIAKATYPEVLQRIFRHRRLYRHRRLRRSRLACAKSRHRATNRRRRFAPTRRCGGLARRHRELRFRDLRRRAPAPPNIDAELPIGQPRERHAAIVHHALLA